MSAAFEASGGMTIPAAEALLAGNEQSREASRQLSHARRLDAWVLRSLRRRGEFTEGVEEDVKTYRTLAEGAVRFRSPTGDPGVNSTEEVSLVRNDGQGMEHQTFGFSKCQRGERTIGWDQGTGELYEMKPYIDVDGKLTIKREPLVATASDTEARRVRVQKDGEYLQYWYQSRPQNVARLAKVYGIKPEEVPFPMTEVGYRHVDQGHAARAEVVAYTLAMAIGFNEVPMTVLREDAGEIASVQEAKAGVALAKSGEGLMVYVEGPSHPGAASFMRIAALDYLLKSSDRHAGNLLYNAKNKEFVAIDNGYSLGYSVETGDRHYPLDVSLSVPMETVQLYPNWKLDEDTHAELTRVLAEIDEYEAIQRGERSADELDALPEAVREGMVARMIMRSFRLLHEREDADEQVIPATREIAKKEARLFVERLRTLVALGRPPEIPADYRKDLGIKKAANEWLVAQGRKPFTEPPPVLPAAFLPPPPLPKVKRANPPNA